MYWTLSDWDLFRQVFPGWLRLAYAYRVGNVVTALFFLVAYYSLRSLLLFGPVVLLESNSIIHWAKVLFLILHRTRVRGGLAVVYFLPREAKYLSNFIRRSSLICSLISASFKAWTELPGLCAGYFTDLAIISSQLLAFFSFRERQTTYKVGVPIASWPRFGIETRKGLHETWKIHCRWINNAGGAAERRFGTTSGITTLSGVRFERNLIWLKLLRV